MVNSSPLQKTWPALGAKQPYQQFFQILSWKIFSMPTTSIFSINVSQIKHITSKGKSVSGKKKRSKLRLTGMAAASAIGEKLRMFVIWKSKYPAVSRILSIYSVSTNDKWRVGWTVMSLKSGSVNLDESFVLMIEILLLSLTVVQPPSINLKLEQRSNRVFAPKYDVYSSTDGPRCHKQP